MNLAGKSIPARYETHLDRKLGRPLSMLLKLQEVRRTISAPAA